MLLEKLFRSTKLVYLKGSDTNHYEYLEFELSD